VAFPKFVKDPQAVLDYKIDWSAWLEDDTISASEWSATSGITIDSDSFTDTDTTVWLSGGTVGESYDATNEITTDGGRTDDRTITIQVKQK
jgi:hypothetical protein